MKLGLFLLNMGHHVAAWRHPNAPSDKRLEFDYYHRLVTTAESAKFDFVFTSDFLGIPIKYPNHEVLSAWGNSARFEPMALMSALAVTTKKIGLVATVSTTYIEPYHVARKFSSLDFLSHGRSGWNIVTSATDNEAFNFNLKQQMDHASRYKRAEEFMQVTMGLWNSWEEHAFIFDKIHARHFVPEKLKPLDYSGEYFSVKGPLNIDRCPQGRPVLVQAGSSSDGKIFGARWADVIFTAHYRMDTAQQFYREMKQLAIQFHRHPDDLKIMPGIVPIIGKTKAIAQKKYDDLQALIHEELGIAMLNALLGDVVDLSCYSVDEKLPPIQVTEGNISRQQLVYLEACEKNLTIRELYQSMIGSRGHHIVIGTPNDVADTLETWVKQGAADGFNIMPALFPDHLNDFVEFVIPELQSRKIFRREYEGDMLRENLGFLSHQSC